MRAHVWLLAEHVLFGAAIWLATGAGLLISADFMPLSGVVVLLLAAVWGTGLVLERYQRLNEKSGRLGRAVSG
jgi:hypothetical protein